MFSSCSVRFDSLYVRVEQAALLYKEGVRAPSPALAPPAGSTVRSSFVVTNPHQLLTKTLEVQPVGS
jgi:hypothetical protein